MERARLFASYLFSIALLSLAASLIYCTGQILTALPGLLAQLERTGAQLQPVAEEVGKVSEQVPAILAEVKAVRLQTQSVVEEVAAVRTALPAVIAESAAIRQQVPPVLAEVEAVRTMLPEILGQAQQLVLAARDAGRQASEGAVTGFLTGIVKAPFSMLSGVGGRLFGGTELTQEDLEAIDKAARELLERDQPGSRTSWSNRNTGTSGSIDLALDSDGRPHCRALEFRSARNGKALPEQKLVVCQGENEGWVIESVPD